MQTPLQLADFSYTLPEELIAQTPLAVRDEAKLLCWKNGQITHKHVNDLINAVPEGSLFIVNDSRVIASRIRFTLPTGAQAEFLLLEPTDQHSSNKEEQWLALARPMRKLRTGQTIHVGHGQDILSITILGENDPGKGTGPTPIRIAVSKRGSDLLDWLNRFGEMPLPPYIERRNVSSSITADDKIRYQTVYANGTTPGSVAAPTAGLHFTDEIIQKLKSHNCEFANVTLHVGAGTFLPVKTANIGEHEMHTERFLVPKATLQAIEKAKTEGRSVIVVGTTALRSLEGLKALSLETQRNLLDLADHWHRTKIFIRPEFVSSRYRPWAADALMTNFHQPESTLLMLVSALVGYDQIRSIYQTAIDNQYRFFSYGDSSLLWL